MLFAVTSFGRTQFTSTYGLILRASQIRHSKSIGFAAKVHAASVQRRLDSSASIKLFIFGLLISIESMTLCSPCPCIQTGCTVEFEERRLCRANLVVPRNSCAGFGATVDTVHIRTLSIATGLWEDLFTLLGGS